MTRVGRGLALVLALVMAGCVSVEEAPPAVEPAPEAPPAAEAPPSTVAKPTTAPAPKVATIAPTPAPETVRANDVETLIGEFARLRRASPAELAREQEAARLTFNASRTDASRVKLAMAISIPGAPGTDDTRALDLLDPLVKTPGATQHALAVLLASYIQEQRRLGAQVVGLQQNVQGLQQNVQGLQQKLDAITKLERSLTGRGEPGAPRRK